MNAGAHGGTVLERVTRLTTLRAGVLTDTTREKLVYGYRFLELAPGEIIVAAEFGLESAERAAIDARLAASREHRTDAQRVGFPSAGSWFRNPPGEAAWRLIEAAGLRGHQIGGAQVSEVHTNFLVNRGSATARDFQELAAFVKERVQATSGIELAEEVRIVGEEIGD
jgi:UDP-N-acetylmuramate dehydrogenase